jgi:hypothetical protein
MTAGISSEGPSLGTVAVWPGNAAAGRVDAGWARTFPLSAGIDPPGPWHAGNALDAGPASAPRQRIAACVESALLAVEAEVRAVERRTLPRFPYPYPVYLTPLDVRDQPLAERTIAVIGRHLSAQGIDFYCPWPLAERRMVVSLDGKEAGWLGLVVELTWCRFSRHGWYDNGGRFLAVVPSPLATTGGNRRFSAR